MLDRVDEADVGRQVGHAVLVGGVRGVHFALDLGDQRFVFRQQGQVAETGRSAAAAADGNGEAPKKAKKVVEDDEEDELLNKLEEAGLI